MIHWCLKKKKKITYFQYKKWLWTGIFLLYHVLGMSKIRKNIGFDAFLVFEQRSDLHFFSLIYCRGCYLPIDVHYNYIFWLQKPWHTYNHAFLMLVVFPVGKR